MVIGDRESNHKRTTKQGNRTVSIAGHTMMTFETRNEE